MFFVPVSATLHRRAFQRPPTAHASAAASRTPRLDVVENAAGYSVVLDMPGVAKDQLDVQIDGRRVTVSTKAAAQESTADAGARILHRERGNAPYARSVTLPDDVDDTQSHAHLENGVLTLTIARRSPTKVPVN